MNEAHSLKSQHNQTKINKNKVKMKKNKKIFVLKKKIDALDLLDSHFKHDRFSGSLFINKSIRKRKELVRKTKREIKKEQLSNPDLTFITDHLIDWKNEKVTWLDLKFPSLKHKDIHYICALHSQQVDAVDNLVSDLTHLNDLKNNCYTINKILFGSQKEENVFITPINANNNLFRKGYYSLFNFISSKENEENEVKKYLASYEDVFNKEHFINQLENLFFNKEIFKFEEKYHYGQGLTIQTYKPEVSLKEINQLIQYFYTNNENEITEIIEKDKQEIVDLLTKTMLENIFFDFVNFNGFVEAVYFIDQVNDKSILIDLVNRERKLGRVLPSDKKEREDFFKESEEIRKIKDSYWLQIEKEIDPYLFDYKTLRSEERLKEIQSFFKEELDVIYYHLISNKDIIKENDEYKLKTFYVDFLNQINHLSKQYFFRKIDLKFVEKTKQLYKDLENKGLILKYSDFE